MTGTVQSVALEGRPGHRPWRRGQEVRASTEEMQELLQLTPLEMHKVGAGAGHGRPGCVAWCCEDPPGAPDGPAPLGASFFSTKHNFILGRTFQILSIWVIHTHPVIHTGLL